MMSVIQGLGFDSHLTKFGNWEMQKRLGYPGEVNWPCDFAHWNGKGRDAYLAHWSPSQNHTVDKSTIYLSAKGAPLLRSALPSSTLAIANLCDPIAQLWSRMNHQRTEITIPAATRAENVNTCNPTSLRLTVVPRRL